MSIGGNADEKLRLLVVAGKGDALREYNSRGVLNTRSVARIQHLLPGHKYGLLYSLRAVFGWRGKIQNLYESKQKPLPKSSNPLKGLNNLFISYEKQNTKEAYNSNGNLERV